MDRRWRHGAAGIDQFIHPPVQTGDGLGQWMLAVLLVRRRRVGLRALRGWCIRRTGRWGTVQAVELAGQLVETFMHGKELIVVALVVIMAVARQPHAFFVRGIEDHGVQPFTDRHAGAARGLPRGLSRVRADAFHSPRNAKFHAHAHVAERRSGEPDGPAEPALLEAKRMTARSFSSNRSLPFLW
jgi:hypothetical protein